MLTPQDAMHVLNEHLRLDTYPVGVAFVNGESEFPPKTRTVSYWGLKMSICQIISLARKWDMLIGARPEDINCASAQLAFGWFKVAKGKSQEEVVVEFLKNMQYVKDEGTAKRTLEYLPWIREGWVNEKRGVLIGSLNKWTFGEPEVVLIYGNTSQIARLVQARVYMKGGVVKSEAQVGLTCAMEILGPKLKGEVSFVIPGRGERQLGMAGNEEMVFVLPWAEMPDLVEGVKRTQEAGSRYPVPQYLFFRPMYLPPIEKLRSQLQPNVQKEEKEAKEPGVDAELLKKAEKLFGEGYYCSQVTAILLQEKLGIGSDEALKALAAFSGGVGRDGGNCGALNASLVMIGLALGKGKEGKEDPRMAKYIRKVYDRFANEISEAPGSVYCRDIAGVNWWNAAEAREFLSDPLRISQCRRMIARTVAMVSEVFEEIKAERSKKETES